MYPLDEISFFRPVGKYRFLHLWEPIIGALGITLRTKEEQTNRCHNEWDMFLYVWCSSTFSLEFVAPSPFWPYITHYRHECPNLGHLWKAHLEGHNVDLLKFFVRSFLLCENWTESEQLRRFLISENIHSIWLRYRSHYDAKFNMFLS